MMMHDDVKLVRLLSRYGLLLEDEVNNRDQHVLEIADH